MNANGKPDLMSRYEVMETLACSRHYVDKLVESGTLTVCRPLRKGWRKFYRRQVQALLEPDKKDPEAGKPNQTKGANT